MGTVEVSANSFHEFSIDRFCVVAELLAQRHEFTFESKEIVISIPLPDKDDVPYEHRRVECWKWKTEGRVPLEYVVRSIDLEIKLGITLRLPEAVMHKPPNQFDLVSEKQQGHLNQTIQRAQALANGAFDYWMSVLRWKSRIGYIGEPEVRYASGARALLRDSASAKRLWLPPSLVSVSERKAVTPQDWAETQRALSTQRLCLSGFLSSSRASSVPIITICPEVC